MAKSPSKKLIIVDVESVLVPWGVTDADWRSRGSLQDGQRVAHRPAVDLLPPVRRTEQNDMDAYQLGDVLRAAPDNVTIKLFFDGEDHSFMRPDFEWFLDDASYRYVCGNVSDLRNADFWKKKLLRGFSRNSCDAVMIVSADPVVATIAHRIGEIPHANICFAGTDGDREQIREFTQALVMA